MKIFKNILTFRHLLIALMYSAIYPITNIFGGEISLFGMAITFPFLFIASACGMVIIGLVGTENAYFIGAYPAVVIQVLVCTVMWVIIKRCILNFCLLMKETKKGKSIK
jgi:hypothetical protein